jgi:hypothetical protein
MGANSASVSVSVVSGPSISVPWVPGMNAQQALEAAYDALKAKSEFTYALQYFGSQLGYLVVMINETYESFMSAAHPFFFWEFLVNGKPAQTGIDGTNLNPGDSVTFELQTYDAQIHAHSTVKAKLDSRLRAGASH